MSSVTIDAPRQEGVVTVTVSPNTNGFIQPTQDESRRLMNLVRAAYPRLTLDNAAEFHRAMIASGYMHRHRAGPNQKYSYMFILDAANRLLAERFGLSTVSSDHFLGACIAHGDVPYVFFNANAGQMTGVGLDPYSGTKCQNTWKKLLAGQCRLLTPTPPRPAPNRQVNHFR
jgi:hypothetical protein